MSSPAVRRRGGAQRRRRTSTGRPSEAGTVITLAGDDTPGRSPKTGGQRAGRADGEYPAVGVRTVVDGSEVILHGEAYEALARR
ncbi:hypothetical protein [Streptomyces sp. NPDC060002]|uniref:hypothetical protein n=1 Tax=Streptomyces sp. NPDC060002 TaxID=3347033 RepID=UPI0036BDAC0E